MITSLRVLVMMAVVSVMGVSTLCAQMDAGPAVSDQDIKLLRQDLRSQKKQLVAMNMQLTDAEAIRFWPVYDQYTAEIITNNDARLAMIKEYAQNYATMTDAQADSFIRKATDLDEKIVKLRAKYIPIFQKVIPVKKSALFFQIDRRIGLLLEIQLASGIPLIEP